MEPSSDSGVKECQPEEARGRAGEAKPACAKGALAGIVGRADVGVPGAR
jgi:hypothetical protein